MKQLKSSGTNASKKRYSTYLIRFFPIISILSIVVIFFWKFFIFGQIPIPGDIVIGTYYPWLDYKWGYSVGVPVKNPITTDVVSFTYPMRTLAIEMLKSGQWPLWNKNILTGIPLLANFQAAPFTVTNILYFLFNTKIAWGLQVVSQHFLAAFFMYLLLDRWGLSKKAAVFSGILFAFSGFNLIWSQWNAHTLVSAFIPILIYLVDRYLAEGKTRYGLSAAFVLIFQFFAGYPQLLIYSFLAVALYYLIIFKKNSQFIKRTIFITFYFIFGAGVTAIQLIPAKELLDYSQRAVEPLSFIGAFLPWQKIITFVAPDYFGNHSTYNYWGPTDYTMTTGFVGVVGFSLAIFAFKFIKTNKIIFYSALLVLISLLLAFPTPISIYIWKSGFLGLQAASAHRALVIFNFAIAILAGFGLENISKQIKLKINFLLFPLLLLGGFSLYVIFGFVNVKIFTFPHHAQLMVAFRNLILPWVIFILFSIMVKLLHKKILKLKYFYVLIFTLMVIEIFRFGWKFTPFTKTELIFPETPVLAYLKKLSKPFRVVSTDIVPINMKMPYHIESLEGYDAIYPVNIAKYIAVSNSNNVNSDPQGRYSSVTNYFSSLNSIANAKYFLTVKKDMYGKPAVSGILSAVFTDTDFEKVFEDKTTVVLKNNAALDRAKMFYDWVEVANNKDALDILVDDKFNYKDKLILNSSKYSTSPKKGKYNISWSKYSYQESILNVTTSDNGYLFISDLYYPGWKADIDGIQVEIKTANYAFSAIYVTKGKHIVRFYYQPESFYLGLKISMLSFCLLLLYTYTIKNLTYYGKKNK